MDMPPESPSRFQALLSAVPPVIGIGGKRLDRAVALARSNTFIFAQV
ncbi:hypothetical protein [Ensifer aridi]|nr:hypothetical protein [Ensifer aridi]